MSDSTMSADEYGNKLWRNSKGQTHRTDGPACEYSSGDKEWWVNDRLHRLNGPAIEWEGGENWWYVNGKYLGDNDEGFWELWDRLTPEQKQDPVLLSYLPEKF